MCELFPEQNLDPLDVHRWPWHRRVFYEEWAEQKASEVTPQQEVFDPTKPWTGDAMAFDLAAIGATRVGG